MQQPSKQQVMLLLLEDAWVYVHLDPRRDGVILPAHLRQEARMVLQYGYNMPIPIADFVIDDRGIGATLSFRRVSTSTFIPWSAVFAVTDGDRRTLVWPEDLPADLKLEEDVAQSQVETATPLGPARPALSSVGPDEEAPKSAVQSGGGGTGSAGKPGKKPRPSYLKLVD